MKNQKGFTLLEMAVAAVIGLFVMGMTTSLLFAGTQVLRSVGVYHSMYQETRNATQWINRDVKESYGILNSATIGGIAYSTGVLNLVLQRSSGQSGDYDYVIYSFTPDPLGTGFSLQRKFFDNYDINGNEKINSSSSARVIAKNLTAAGFGTSGDEVILLITASREDWRAQELTVPFGGHGASAGSGNNILETKMSLASQTKMRN